MIYFIIPKKFQYIWLLITSYYFYMCWNAKYALLLLFSTIVTYISGILLQWIKNQKWNANKSTRYKKCCVAFSFILNLGVLGFFKYINFFLKNINSILGFLNVELNMPSFDIILPVGISFYTFQALSYTMDVYRDEIYAEKNFFRYALFVSFFPQLVAGPIERSRNLLKQLSVPAKFNYDLARDGLLLMIWGFFLKIVLADRIAIFVDTAYGDYAQYGGVFLLLATILFAIQIYCDFYGYSVIAMGAAEILGIDLMENFNAPYLSKSVSEFWRRWHISLNTWFRDYLYIPLGGNRKGNVRRYLNLMTVFLVSGLWHGANWTFIIWGGLNGVYQILESVTKRIRDRWIEILCLKKKSFSHKLLQVSTTFILIDFSWIFFRASSVSDAIAIIKSMISVHNPWIFFDESLFGLGLDRKNFYVMLISIFILFLADAFKYNDIVIREKILEQDWWFRQLTFVGSIILILIYGIWGTGYNQSGFIYFQF